MQGPAGKYRACHTTSTRKNIRSFIRVFDYIIDSAYFAFWDLGWGI